MNISPHHLVVIALPLRPLLQRAPCLPVLSCVELHRLNKKPFFKATRPSFPSWI
jgi:hypothetical protein